MTETEQKAERAIDDYTALVFELGFTETDMQYLSRDDRAKVLELREKMIGYLRKAGYEAAMRLHPHKEDMGK